jgi:large subunit ribosomal protein L3
MTRLFDDNGVATATTLIEAGPCWVTQLELNPRQGWHAVQIGYGETKAARLTGGQLGHLGFEKPKGKRISAGQSSPKKSLPILRHLREVPADPDGEVKVGDRIDASIFNEGDVVDVVGTSKGRGFAGVVKRHGFAGGPKTHGQSDRWRAPGSIGSGTTPGRVMKGMKMAGHMGSERVTVKNLRVLRVDPARNLVAVKGAVPGPNGGLVLLKKRTEQ